MGSLWALVLHGRGLSKGAAEALQGVVAKYRREFTAAQASCQATFREEIGSIEPDPVLSAQSSVPMELDPAVPVAMARMVATLISLGYAVLNGNASRSVFEHTREGEDLRELRRLLDQFLSE